MLRMVLHKEVDWQIGTWKQARQLILSIDFLWPMECFSKRHVIQSALKFKDHGHWCGEMFYFDKSLIVRFRYVSKPQYLRSWKFWPLRNLTRVSAIICYGPVKFQNDTIRLTIIPPSATLHEMWRTCVFSHIEFSTHTMEGELKMAEIGGQRQNNEPTSW